MPFSAIGSHELTSVDDLKLLTVGVDRLETWWRPGVLCIGDAAHTMSPIGGVGINLAIQDAVAASNILAAPLRERPAEGFRPGGRAGAAACFRCAPPRRCRSFVQNRMIAPTLPAPGRCAPPWPVRLLNRFPSCAAAGPPAGHGRAARAREDASRKANNVAWGGGEFRTNS